MCVLGQLGEAQWDVWLDEGWERNGRLGYARAHGGLGQVKVKGQLG